MPGEEAVSAPVFLVILSAAEAAGVAGGCVLWEIGHEIEIKGGSDALVAVGFPVIVARADRRREVARAAVMACVKAGWCDVLRVEASFDERGMDHLDKTWPLVGAELAQVLDDEANWTYPNTSIEVRLTELGWQGWRTGELGRRFLSAVG